VHGAGSQQSRDRHLGLEAPSHRTKKVGLIGDFRRLAVLHLIDVDSIGIEKSAMKELRLERQLFAAPERAFWQKPYRPVAIVVEVLQIIRQFNIWSLERFTGEVTRHLPHNGSIKRGRLRASGGQESWRRDRYERQGGSCEEVSAVHKMAHCY
jgi:hypothetical protein